MCIISLIISISVSDPYTASTLNHFVDPAESGNARSLEFISNNLGKEIDLLLMFEPPKVGKLYVDLFPVCWSE